MSKKTQTIYLPYFEQSITKEALVSKIATYIFVTVVSETSTGNWCLTTKEIEQNMMLPNGIVKQLVNDITKELASTYPVQDIDTYPVQEANDVYIDVYVYHDYLPGFVQEDNCLEDL